MRSESLRRGPPTEPRRPRPAEDEELCRGGGGERCPERVCEAEGPGAGAPLVEGCATCCAVEEDRAGTGEEGVDEDAAAEEDPWAASRLPDAGCEGAPPAVAAAPFLLLPDALRSEPLECCLERGSLGSSWT